MDLTERVMLTKSIYNLSYTGPPESMGIIPLSQVCQGLYQKVLRPTRRGWLPSG